MNLGITPNFTTPQSMPRNKQSINFKASISTPEVIRELESRLEIKFFSFSDLARLLLGGGHISKEEANILVSNNPRHYATASDYLEALSGEEGKSPFATLQELGQKAKSKAELTVAKVNGVFAKFGLNGSDTKFAEMPPVDKRIVLKELQIDYPSA